MSGQASEQLPAAAPPTASSSGLVSLATSDTEKDVLLVEGGLMARLAKMRRRVISTANAIQELMQAGGHQFRVVMITTTYRPDVEWEPRHITAMLNCYKAWARRRGIEIAYTWVMELHKSGKPHYHVLLWLPRGVTPPLPDKQGWWKHGSTNAVWAYSPVGYIAKYASKGTAGGGFPANARIDGSGGLSKEQQALRSWLCAPKWLKDFVARGNRIKKRAGGWWEDTVTGNQFRTPWLFEGFQNGKIKLRWIGWTSDDVILWP